MAAVVKTNCSDGCGPVDVPGDEITLAIWPQMNALSTYSFPCPGCHRIQTREATGVIQSLLVAGGVPAKQMQLPEHGAQEGVSPIDEDDLLALCWSLRDTDSPTELLEEPEDG